MKKKQSKSIARKISTVPSGIFTYGVIEPLLVKNTKDILHNESRASHLYKNSLVQIERDRRIKFSNYCAGLNPDIHDIKLDVIFICFFKEIIYQELINLPDPEYSLSGKKRCLPKHKRANSNIARALEAAIKDIGEILVGKYKLLKNKQEEILEKYINSYNDEFTYEVEQYLLNYLITNNKNSADKASKFLGKSREYLKNNDLKNELKELDTILSSIGPRSIERVKAKNESLKKLQTQDGCEVWSHVKILDNVAEQTKKEARLAAKCSSGTYLAVEKAIQASFRDTIGLPRFFNWDGRGLVGIQLGSVSTQDLIDGKIPNLSIQFDDVPVRGNSKFSELVRSMPQATSEEILTAAQNLGFKRRNGKNLNLRWVEPRVLDIRNPAKEPKSKKYFTYPRIATLTINLGCRVVIQQNKKGENVRKDKPMGELKIPIKMHRPLPDGIIKWVYVKINKCGTKYNYELQFTMESDYFNKNIIPGTDSVIIKLGTFRRDDGEIVIATEYNVQTKESKEILLPSSHGPASMEQRNEQVKRVLSYADNHFDDAKEFICGWMKNDPEIINSLKIDSNVSGYLKKKLDTMIQWKSHGNLAALAKILTFNVPYITELWKKWKSTRKKYKQDLFDTYDNVSSWFENQNIESQWHRSLYLEWWRRKDEHLINMARNIQLSLKKWQLDFYRKKANELARTYNHILIEELGGRKSKKKLSSNDEKSIMEQTNINQMLDFVGISRFTQALKEIALDRVKSLDVKSKYKEHAGCGGQENFSDDPECAVCNKCQSFYNRRNNAIHHMLNTEREWLNDVEGAVPARNYLVEENQQVSFHASRNSSNRTNVQTDCSPTWC